MTTSENRERQSAELTLLSTMYPSEFTWRSDPPPDFSLPDLPDPTFALILNPSYTLEFALPITYPSTSKPHVYLSCGETISTSTRKQARSTLASIIEDQPSDLEILDLIATAFSDVLPTLSQPPPDTTDHSTHPKTTDSHAPKIKRIVIWSHHLLATSKRKDIQSWSRELHLSGYARPGYPGAIFAEGDADEIDEFVSRLKALRWQALQVRAEETGTERVCGDGKEGVVEVEGLGDVAEGLKAKSERVAEMFLEGMKIAGSSH